MEDFDYSIESDDDGECQKMYDLLTADHSNDNENLSDECFDYSIDSDDDCECQQLANWLSANEIDNSEVVPLITQNNNRRKRGKQKAPIQGVVSPGGKRKRGKLQQQRQNMNRKMQRFKSKVKKLRSVQEKLQDLYFKEQHKKMQERITTPEARQKLINEFHVDISKMEEENDTEKIKAYFLQCQIWADWHMKRGCKAKTRNLAIMENSVFVAEA